MTRAHLIDGWRIDISIRDGVPSLLPRTAIARTVAAALRAAGAPSPASLSIVLTDDEELAALNETHLGHQGATDVLSFPLLPPDAFPPHVGREGGRTAAGAGLSAAAFVLPPRRRVHLGDIAVSIERAVAQAEAGLGGQTGDVRWSATDELRLLLTHGTLHICGWDHAEPAEQAAMRALENELRRRPGPRQS
ncbi:MAG: rRNA maturation RNase YbeY [Chloroflexota bacterium]